MYAARGLAHRPSQTANGAEGERCEELKLNALGAGRGDAARGPNVEREKQMQILEKITLDDVRASWSVGYSACHGGHESWSFGKRDATAAKAFKETCGDNCMSSMRRFINLATVGRQASVTLVE